MSDSVKSIAVGVLTLLLATATFAWWMLVLPEFEGESALAAALTVLSWVKLAVER